MLHEYALDPFVLSNWPSFRYFYEKFGVAHGRLISRFPKKWKKMVYEACGGCGDIERKRIEEKLRDIDAKLLPTGRSYDGNLAWLNNAEVQHRLQPFHAIIANENPRQVNEILIANDIDENMLLWKVPREIRVPRKAADLTKCLATLLQNSTEILFVDPHFRPYESRYKNALRHLVEAACATNSKLKRLEYHLKENPATPAEFFKSECCSKIPALVSHGIEMIFIRWRQREGGESLHPRYVLTDRGGVRVEHGLDEGEEGETTDISLLDEALYQQRWADFQKTTAAFEFVDEVMVKGIRKR
jgi:hypothetical protein